MPPFIPRKRLRSPSPDPKTSKPPPSGKATTKISARKPTLFDALDAGAGPSRPAGQTKNLLSRLDGSDDDDEDSELSSLSSAEFEHPSVSKRQKVTYEASDDEDEDIQFEDVQTHAPSPFTAPPPSGDLDLTLNKETRISLVNPHNKKQGPSKIERQIRLSTHCMHVQFLMWHNAVRNAWLCDGGLHKILLEQLRMTSTGEKEIEKWRLRSGIGSKNDGDGNLKRKLKGETVDKPTDSRNQRDWGPPAQNLTTGSLDKHYQDPLLFLLNFLSKYWKQRFRICIPGLRKIGYMSLQRLDEEMKSFKDSYDYEMHGERIRGRKELQTCAKNCEGSRDLGAQLFAALLRAIGLDARMVVSLQPIGFGWSRNEDAVERKVKDDKKKEQNNDLTDQESTDNETEVTASTRKASSTKKFHTRTPQTVGVKRGRGQGNENFPIDLSASESDESVIDVTPQRPKKGPSKLYEKDLSPNYWVEVLSPVTNTYIVVDPFAKDSPVVTKPEHLGAFEPRGAKAERAKQVMAYVVGFSRDGTAKDVTVRYLKRHMWPGKTKGVRMPVEKVPIYDQRGKVKRYEEADWFKTVMSGYERRHFQRGPADELEEATDLLAVKPEKKAVKEGEETLQSYKTSDEFVLERHLKREEALLPNATHVKIFVVKGKKGEEDVQEKVYSRADVVSCKSIETWHKEGREPIIGEQPLKRVPYRAATINRKRELAEAEAASGGQKMLQGLYSRNQTDWIIPPPIQNGVIPKNSYGNMDVYVPSMVPEGAVHIPYRGTVKVCKKLGIDFAEAVTGFEFGMRMAVPIITGVVVAEEYLQAVMEQWEQDEAERNRKEDEKRTKAALGMWRRLLMGMRIVQRVKEEYGDHADENVDVLNPWTNKNARAKRPRAAEDETARRIMDHREEEMSGGFLRDGQDAEEPVQSFFPTRHDDGPDEGGGFIIEGHNETLNSALQDVGAAYATPVSNESSKGMNVEISDESMEESGSGAIQNSSKPRGRQKNTKTAAEIKRRANSGRGRSTGAVVQFLPKKALAPKSANFDDEEEDSSSSLSDIKESSSDEAPQPKKRSRAGRLEAPKSSPRSVPQRRAAKKSETALKSHYFDHSDDE